MENIEQQWPYEMTSGKLDILWSPVTEFRVVDEVNSSELKGALNVIYLLLFYEYQKIENMFIKNLALNGNGWEE